MHSPSRSSRSRRSPPARPPPAARLTGGECRGVPLATPEGAEVRPAQAVVRKSLFDILAGRVDDARCLDLFAGTGAVGLEALSRGAATCLFVDVDPRCTEAIQRNLEKTRLAARGMVLCQDALGWPAAGPHDWGRYDLIFVDPPYRFWDDTEAGPALRRLLDFLPAAPALSPGGLVICEHPARLEITTELGRLRRADRREYGQTAVTLMAAR